MTNNTGGSSTQAKSHDYRVKHYKRSKTEPEYTPSDFATVNDNAISDTLCARFFYKYQVKACQKKEEPEREQTVIVKTISMDVSGFLEIYAILTDADSKRHTVHIILKETFPLIPQKAPVASEKVSLVHANYSPISTSSIRPLHVAPECIKGLYLKVFNYVGELLIVIIIKDSDISADTDALLP
ncbi:hypothetical protein CLF_106520 [Clonorchis sinensis]|uniref:Uncharacterized protein n=1 Tax=Clonorchis sinensis TaxID=79923 RepID=G7YQ05_CLOSI|nr:hypothetical protein CLF_106520 [Clonorchis sinensis]